MRSSPSSSALKRTSGNDRADPVPKKEDPPSSTPQLLGGEQYFGRGPLDRLFRKDATPEDIAAELGIEVNAVDDVLDAIDGVLKVGVSFLNSLFEVVLGRTSVGGLPDPRRANRIFKAFTAQVEAQLRRAGLLTPTEAPLRARGQKLEPLALVELGAYTAEKPTDAAKLLQDKRIITRQGHRQIPLSAAAEQAQAPQSTLVEWIKARKKFQGRLIRTYRSPKTNLLYVTEESLERIANRFVKWPSREPAGQVILGETDDQSGFLGLPDAMRILGISNRTMYLWATQGKAPTNKPLDVIRCSASEHFYMREKDIYELKALVPRSGLQRGRRRGSSPALLP